MKEVCQDEMVLTTSSLLLPLFPCLLGAFLLLSKYLLVTCILLQPYILHQKLMVLILCHRITELMNVFLQIEKGSIVELLIFIVKLECLHL